MIVSGVRRLANLVAMVVCVLSVGCRSSTSDVPGPVRSGESPTGPFVLVLGVAQDGGVPQAGNVADPRWNDPSTSRSVASIAIVDPSVSKYWIVDATPDFPAQMQRASFSVAGDTLSLAGVFLTHAHIGHYTGLMYLGHEAMGAQQVPVYAMPRMKGFLSTNGPWDQLVRYRNIELVELAADSAESVSASVSVTPFLVPHRQEYTEVVGFRIELSGSSVIYIPDIDSWSELDESGTRIEDLIAESDVALLDATFFDNGELPGRDMSGFPHPFIRASMARFDRLSTDDKNKVRFIHLNHSNPALINGSAERDEIYTRGYGVAEEGDRFPVSVGDRAPE